MERLTRLFLRHHKLLLISSLLVVVGLVAAVPKFKLRPDKPTPIAYPSPEDPERRYLETTQDVFAEGYMTLIGLEAPNILTPETIERIRVITEEIGQLEGVVSILSITNVEEVETKGGTLGAEKLIEKISMTPEGMRALKAMVERNRLLRGRIVSDDGTFTMISVSIDSHLTAAQFHDLIDQMGEIVRKHPGPAKVYFAGLDVITNAIEKATYQDIFRQVPLLILACCVILFFNFRGVRNMLTGVGIICLGIVATFGAMALADIPLTALTGMLPAILLVTGISYTLYLISEFYSQYWSNPGAGRDQIVALVIRQVWLAVFLCAFTTVIGFVSLCTNKISGIREMGLAATLGTCVMLLLNLVTLSAGVFYLAKPRHHLEADRPKKDFLDRGLHWLHVMAERRGVFILIGAAVIFVGSVVGMTRIVSETDVRQFFRKGHEVRDAMDVFEAKLHGADFSYIVLEGKTPDRFMDPAVLKNVEALENDASRLPHVAQVLSTVDFLKWTNRILKEDLPEEERIPETREGVAQAFLVYQMVDHERELSHYMTEDGSRIRLSIRSNVGRGVEVRELAGQLRDLCSKYRMPDIECRVTSPAILGAQTADQLTNGMMGGFAFGVFLIFLTMVALFRSLKLGVIAMVPNVLPILLSLGYLGWSSFPLDVGTSLMAPIVIGMTVDDTIRFFVRYFFELRQSNHFLIRRTTGVRITEDQKIAMRKAMEEISRPMVLASLTILLGFGALWFSSFIPIQRLGLLTVLTMFACVLGDLLLLPAILTRIRI